jgi:rod shape-determining protein MreD
VQISYTSSAQVQVQRFTLPVSVGLPLAAIILQAYLPKYLHFLSILDLPLLVTIFFAVARRNQLSGLLTGGVIGIMQDSLTSQLIGLFGIAKTVIGYLASSIGVKLDVENPGSRFLMTFAFYVLHSAIFYVVARGLANQMTVQLRWGHLLLAALVNAFVAVPLFAALDMFKQRT